MENRIIETKKSDIKVKSLELLRNAETRMEQNLEHLLASGCIDIDRHNYDYYLPSIIVCALAMKMKDTYYPNDKNAVEEY